MSVTTSQAITLLENVLFESSTLAAANAAQWVSSSAALGDVETAMANSPEAGIAEQVVRYYEGALGRVPDSAEIAFYVTFAEKGLSSAQIAEGASGVPTSVWGEIAGFFAASPEFATRTAGGNVITNFYQNILDRTPSADEVAFYQKALDSGTTASTLLQYFVNSAEYQGKVNGGIAGQLAANGDNALTNTSATPGYISSGAGTSTVSIDDSMTGSAVSLATGGYTSATVTSTTIATLLTTDITSGSPALTFDTIAGVETITLNEVTAITSFSFGDSQATAYKVDLSHIAGSSALTYTLPSGSDAFIYDGMTFHFPVGTASIELVGVSASQITLLPAHS